MVLDVIPALQRRGLVKDSYEPGTFRERLFGAGHARLSQDHPAARFRVGATRRCWRSSAMTYAVLPPYQADPGHLRETFSYFPSGVVALLAEVDGQPQALVASAFTVGVSINPPLVSCAIQLTSCTWPF